MSTTGFFLLWFVLVPLAAAVLNLGFDTTVQFTGFILVSVILPGIKAFCARITGEPSKKAASDRLIVRKQR